MESDEERRAMREIKDRLSKRFPTASDAEVRAVVDDSYNELDGAPIRSFVGILVEKQASDRLAGTAP